MTSSVELGLSVSANKDLPATWVYSESVNKVKALITSFKTASADMLHELWVAREMLSRERGTSVANATLTWSAYCKDAGIDRTTIHRWLSQYDPIEREKIEKPSPTPEEIQHKKESQDRMTAHLEEDRKLKNESKMYVPGDVDDLINEARQYVKSEKDAAGLALDGKDENLAQMDIFLAIDRYVFSFPGVSRQLEATQNLIKKLRAMAVQLHGES